MSSEISPSQSDGAQLYLSVWASSACDVLKKITGSDFAGVELADSEVAEAAATLRPEGVWLRFEVGQALQGKQSIGMSEADALRLAQILTGEPPDETQALSPDYQDALAELLRQFAGTAAVALKPHAGGEVTLQFAGYGAANWTPHTQSGFRLKSEQAGQFLLLLCLDSVLGNSLLPKASEKVAAPAGPSSRGATVAPAVPTVDNRNIDLMLDIDLQVALRFGKREVTLGEILELNAGAVV